MFTSIKIISPRLFGTNLFSNRLTKKLKMSTTNTKMGSVRMLKPRRLGLRYDYRSLIDSLGGM